MRREIAIFFKDKVESARLSTPFTQLYDVPNMAKLMIQQWIAVTMTKFRRSSAQYHVSLVSWIRPQRGL